MSNSLTVKNGRQLIDNTYAMMLAELPKWLQYLIGAFPAAKVNKYTFLAYEEQFSDIDERIMLTAVRLAVREHRFSTFPTIAELRATVTKLQETAVPKPVQMDLNAMRHELLERAYAGDIDPKEWRLLIVFLRKAGRDFAAEKMERKLKELAKGL